MVLYAFCVLIGFTLALFSFLVFLAVGDGVVTPVSPHQYLILKDYVSPLVSGFVGALAGALCAYFLSKSQQARRELEQAAELYVSTLYTVSAMLEGVAGLIENVVRPDEELPARFLRVPHLGYSLGNYDLEADKRIFGVFVRLRAIDANPKLIAAASKYKSLCHQIADRRNVMNEYWDIRNARGDTGRTWTLHEVSDVVGYTRILNIYEATEGFIKTLSDAEAALLDLLVYLTDKGKAYFTGKGVRVFLPRITSKDCKPISPPKIASVDDLKTVLEKHSLSPIRIADKKWTLPGAFVGPIFFTNQ